MASQLVMSHPTSITGSAWWTAGVARRRLHLHRSCTRGLSSALTGCWRGAKSDGSRPRPGRESAGGWRGLPKARRLRHRGERKFSKTSAGSPARGRRGGERCCVIMEHGGKPNLQTTLLHLRHSARVNWMTPLQPHKTNKTIQRQLLLPSTAW